MKSKTTFMAATMLILASATLADADAFKKPEWFENARFGVFCHWGIQCTPEAGDWYGHNMYKEGHWQNKYHKEHYGDPKEFGLKDFAPLWKAENWNPDELIALYKRMGARYIVAMANHHDNFDNFDSKYQPWNSVKLGPKKDIIGGWAKAARNIERGSPGKPMYPHWQTDTCIGDWHYDRGWFRDNRYRGARGVLRTLVDTVAKNGNLVISIPIRADGTIDEKERAICEEIAAWIEVNGKALFCTKDACAIVSGNAKGGKFLALFNLKNEAAEVSALGVTRRLPPHGSALACIRGGGAK